MPLKIKLGAARPAFKEPKRRETNEEFLAGLMNFNPAGALCQAFILEAVARYAKEVASSPAFADTPYLSGAAWKTCGEHIHRKMEDRFK